MGRPRKKDEDKRVARSISIAPESNRLIEEMSIDRDLPIGGVIDLLCEAWNETTNKKETK